MSAPNIHMTEEPSSQEDEGLNEPLQEQGLLSIDRCFPARSLSSSPESRHSQTSYGSGSSSYSASSPEFRFAQPETNMNSSDEEAVKDSFSFGTVGCQSLLARAVEPSSDEDINSTISHSPSKKSTDHDSIIPTEYFHDIKDKQAKRVEESENHPRLTVNTPPTAAQCKDILDKRDPNRQPLSESNSHRFNKINKKTPRMQSQPWTQQQENLV